MFGCAFGCGVWLHGFLTTSRPGLTLQAVLDEQRKPPPGHGIELPLLAAAIGASLAGLSGGLAALYLNEIHPEQGLRILHKIVCLVIIGGLGYVRGAVFAAFGLACVEGIVVPLMPDLPLPAEAYLLLALFAVSLWPRCRPVPRMIQDVSPDGYRQVTLDSA
jgi:branched-subunit amino acid ABC-type transport system permease component